MAIRKIFCTFPQQLISEPIVSHTLGEKFGVIPNIRAASISDAVALVAVEIEGKEEAIQKSIEYLRERGVKVEEIVDSGDGPKL
ncbi:MAG: NIL domain-containing protein [Planctomycetes bacterium]|nr:NIL domain-containing protein [Planctomycetota bacterium]MCB9904297.1 NIL domain-containing protein [Planctomycetota bacterium]